MKKRRLLVIGDTHVPERASGIPEWMQERIEIERPFEMVVCTGDLEGEIVLDYLRSLAPKLIAVKGNMDWLDLPLHEEFEVNGLKVLVTHGREFWPRGNLKQILETARKLKADIVIHGHTHVMKVCVEDGVLFINPGSATASWSGEGVMPEETFVLAEFEGRRVGIWEIKKEEEKENEYEL